MNKKEYAIFTLKMVSVNTWNGHWTGENNLYREKRKITNGKNLLYPNLTEGDFYYDWDDGWKAKIEVKFVTSKEARDSMKNSKGFLGYDWMIDNLTETGKIK